MMVSVVIPTYNRAHFISRAILSVIKQTYVNWELVIVDDASTDQTETIVKQFSDIRIFYFKLTKNRGASFARNEGIMRSKGDYITFLDSDDEYYPEKISKQLEVFEKSDIRNLGVVSCGRQDFRDEKLYMEWIPKYRGNILKQLLSKKRVGAGTPFLMIKREVIEKGIFFDPEMPAGQDFDFLVRVCMEYNFDFAAYPLVKVNHHNEDRVYSPERALKAFELQFAKYKGILGKDMRVYEMFILKHCDLLFSYGRRLEGIRMLKDNFRVLSLRKYLWFSYFTLFSTVDTKMSKGIIQILRRI